MTRVTRHTSRLAIIRKSNQWYISCTHTGLLAGTRGRSLSAHFRRSLSHGSRSFRLRARSRRESYPGLISQGLSPRSLRVCQVQKLVSSAKTDIEKLFKMIFKSMARIAWIHTLTLESPRSHRSIS